jgi:uncharacterized protein YdaU (DUF1376 family)
MTYTVQDPTVQPAYIMDSYRRAFHLVHKREAHIAHMFDDWYQVNGETVHRLTLFREITRLRELAQKQRFGTADRSVIQRLINKLRGG